MAPSGSKILGNATIWNKKDSPIIWADSFYLVSQMYPLEVQEFVGSSAVAPTEMILEGPPNIIETVRTAPLILEVTLEPPPNVTDYVQSLPSINNVWLTAPYQYGPEFVSTGGILGQLVLRTDTGTDPDPIILYSRWPTEVVQTQGILAEVTLHEP